MVEYWYCTMALCKVGNLRDVCSQGYETPVVHQTVCKLPVHTLRSHCSCVQSMVFWEWYHEVLCFLLGNSPASEFYVPTFWNTLFVPSMKMEQTECSKTSAYKIQTPGSYPEESIQNSEHGGSLKSRDVMKLQAADTSVRCVMLRMVGLSANARILNTLSRLGACDLKWETKKLVHIPWQPSRQGTRKAWSRCWTCRRASTLEAAAASSGVRS